MSTMVSRSTRACAALAIAAGLAGCFDMKQNLVVAEDGTASFNIELSVDAAVIAMGDQNQLDSFCSDSAPVPESLKYSVTQTTERGDLICLIEVTGALDDMAAVIMENAQRAGDGDATSILAREGENYRFEVARLFDVPAPDPENSSFDPTPMMAAMFAGRSVAFTVTAPQIIETSGTISEDGKTATYDYPLALALQEGSTGAEFHAVFSTGGNKFLGLF